MDFWRDLAQVFTENMRINYPGTKKRTYLDTLREMTYNLYRAWIEHIQNIKKNEMVVKQKKFEVETRK